MQEKTTHSEDLKSIKKEIKQISRNSRQRQSDYYNYTAYLNIMK